MGFYHLLPPLRSSLLTVTPLLQFLPLALPSMASSWVLSSTVSVFHMGLCTQATSMTIINNMRSQQDGPWSLVENDRGANFDRSIWKYPEKEQQGQCWWGVCVLRHPLCQPKPSHSPSFRYIARRTGWLLDTNDQLHHPQPFFSLGDHELFTGSFSRFTLYMWYLKSHTVTRLMSLPCECTSGYTCSHVCTPG